MVATRVMAVQDQEGQAGEGEEEGEEQEGGELTYKLKEDTPTSVETVVHTHTATQYISRKKM